MARRHERLPEDELDLRGFVGCGGRKKGHHGSSHLAVELENDGNETALVKVAEESREDEGVKDPHALRESRKNGKLHERGNIFRAYPENPTFSTSAVGARFEERCVRSEEGEGDDEREEEARFLMRLDREEESGYNKSGKIHCIRLASVSERGRQILKGGQRSAPFFRKRSVGFVVSVVAHLSVFHTASAIPQSPTPNSIGQFAMMWR
jgi:hypothetical protein